MMKKNNSGYISAISLLIMAFLLLLTAAVLPRVGAELNFTSINNDGVEAQYAAEAGVKYAAAQILNNPGNTDWSWARGNLEKTFAGGETFKITISPMGADAKPASYPIDDGVALTSGNKYQIKSVGKVNGYLKTVKVIAYINTGSASSPAIYAANNLNVNGTLTINNGDALAGNLNMKQDIKITDGNLLYINSVTAEDWMKNNHKDNLKPYTGTYTYTPDESTITSLPVFSAASNISRDTVNYTSGVSFPSPNSTAEWRRYYTLSSNTKYYVQNTFMQSDNKPITINKQGAGDTYITIKGNYTTSNSGTNYINLNGSGNLVLNIIGDFVVKNLEINANSGSSVTINVLGDLTTDGSGFTVNGPSAGNFNLNVKGILNIKNKLKINGITSGNVNIVVDRNLTYENDNFTISRPAAGNVNIKVNGNMASSSSGIPISGTSTGDVNVFVGKTLSTGGAGIKTDSTTGNVNIFVNSDFSGSGTGLVLTGASAKIVVNGNISFGGTTSITADNSLIYVVGENHNATFENTLTLYGSLIVASGSANINNTTNIRIPDSTGGSGGSSSGTGTIEFSNWSS